MALFNYASKEITIKVVYYGPGLSGKTTNLQYLHPILDKKKKSKLLSLSTESDRTLFFDFLPIELGKIKDFSLRFQLYTVPGQVRYNATRKLVLRGADAVVFVADSQRDMREQNIESFQNMRENLEANNIDPDNIPVVLQYNKRDLANILSEAELDRDLKINDYPHVNAAAIDGTGVMDTFQLTTKLLLQDISKKHHVAIGPPEEEKPDETDIEAEISPAREEVSWGGLEDKEAEPAIETTAYGGALPSGIIEESFPSEEAPMEEPLLEETLPGEIPMGEAIEDIEKLEEEILRTSISEDIYEEKPAGFASEAQRVEMEKRFEAMLKELAGAVDSLKAAVEGLSRDVKEQKAEMPLKSFSKLSNYVENTLVDLSREIKDSKARHNEILGELKELKLILSNLKSKKKWFQI
ncbi:MAG: GTPase domain-containing protein [Thermodesulfovibrionales bacterium]|nr:GTPase domain-containing protein [Thermodesulfovibrionales bacterium]